MICYCIVINEYILGKQLNNLDLCNYFLCSLVVCILVLYLFLTTHGMQWFKQLFHTHLDVKVQVVFCRLEMIL